MLFRSVEGTFEAKFIGVTENDDAEARVLTEVENKIDAASRSQIVNLSFWEIQDGQKSVSNQRQVDIRILNPFFASKRKRSAPKPVRRENDDETLIYQTTMNRFCLRKKKNTNRRKMNHRKKIRRKMN